PRARLGAGAVDVAEAMDVGFATVADHFARVFPGEPEVHHFWERRRRELTFGAVVALFDAYNQTREQILAEQPEELLKLSAPVMPLHDGVLVLPLIGSIGARRAELVIET